MTTDASPNKRLMREKSTLYMTKEERVELKALGIRLGIRNRSDLVMFLVKREMRQLAAADQHSPPNV